MPTLTSVDSDPFAVKLTPVEHDPFSEKPEKTSFLGEMAGNAKQGIKNIKDVATGNYQDIGQYKPTPKTEALADKLFTGEADPSLTGMIKSVIKNYHNTKPSDYSAALLEKFGETPEGKIVGAIGGINPVYNAVGTAMNRNVNPVISKMTGIAPENLNLAELFAGTKAGKPLSKIDPTVPLAKAIPKTGKALAETAISKALPAVDEGLLPVVKIAQKYNIPMSLDEVTGSRALKAIQKSGQDLPFSGQQAFREKQMSAWNKGILNTVGARGERITPETMNDSFKRVGGEFNKLGANKMYNLKGAFEQRNEEIRNEARQTMGQDAIGNFDEAIKDVTKDIDKDGNIAGEKLNKARAKVNALMRKTNNYDTKQLLGDLESNIIDMMTADPESAKNFAKTKQQYKNLIVLEPLVAKGKSGNISPIKLSDRVARVYGRSYTTGQAGEIGELARIGRELLPELGGSDTATRAAYGLGATVGAASHPLVTGAVLGGNRAFQSFINRNQDLIQKAVEQSQ